VASYPSIQLSRLDAHSGAQLYCRQVTALDGSADRTGSEGHALPGFMDRQKGLLFHFFTPPVVGSFRVCP